MLLFWLLVVRVRMLLNLFRTQKALSGIQKNDPKLFLPIIIIWAKNSIAGSSAGGECLYSGAGRKKDEFQKSKRPSHHEILMWDLFKWVQVAFGLQKLPLRLLLGKSKYWMLFGGFSMATEFFVWRAGPLCTMTRSLRFPSIWFPAVNHLILLVRSPFRASERDRLFQHSSQRRDKTENWYLPNLSIDRPGEGLLEQRVSSQEPLSSLPKSDAIKCWLPLTIMANKSDANDWL